jgi:predicted metal-dependent peptidase
MTKKNESLTQASAPALNDKNQLLGEDISLGELFTGLLAGRNKNFYAQVLNALDKIPSPGMGTMGVAIRDRRLVLAYDPEFLKKISFKMGVFAIEHEALHLVLDHIPRYLELLSTTNSEEDKKKLSITANPAMDCAVNDFLRKDPNWAKVESEFPWCLPESYGMAANLSYDEYQRELMRTCKTMTLKIKMPGGQGQGQKGQGQGQGQGQGFGDLDKDFKGRAGNSHDAWGQDMNQDQNGNGGGNGDIEVEVSSFGGAEGMTNEELQSMADELREQAKHILRKAVKEHSSGRGTLPGGLEQWLSKYLAEPVVPWYTLLTTRVKTTQAKKPVRGIQKPNRKLLGVAEEDPTILPAIGRTWDPKFKVFFVVDTSGSMSDKSLQIAVSELQHLLDADEDISVRWMEIDTQVMADNLYKRGDTLPTKVHGRGGTDFNDAFKYMKEKYLSSDECPDIVIYYTDGGAPPIQKENYLPHSIPLIWLICEDAYGGKRAAEHLEQAGYGEVIACDKSQTTAWHEKNRKR